MTKWKRVLAIAVVLVVGCMVGDAQAWHGPRFGYPGYGFGANHHSFYSPHYCGSGFYGSSWNVGYRSYYSSWPSSFYYSSYRSCWPTYRVNYRAAYCAPSVYYSSYYTPYYSSYYAPAYVAPISYYSIPTCSTWPSSTWSIGASSIGYVAPVTYSSGYNVYPSCSTTSVNNTFAIAGYSAPRNQIVSRSPIAANPKTGQLVSTANIGTQQAVKNVPTELLQAADAILAAGGYRQAATAYAQLSLQFGNSSELYARRFVAQVADGDYEQAAVIMDLMSVNKVRIGQSDLPQGNLRAALGVKDQLISKRSEGLAANALVQATDPIPLETIATWLELGGDSVRSKLFQQRAAQLRAAQSIPNSAIDRLAKN